MRQARTKLRGGMHVFAQDVQLGVVVDLRELCLFAIDDVDDRFVAAVGRVQIEGSESGVPDSSSGEGGDDFEVIEGVGVLTDVADEVADEDGVVDGVEVYDNAEEEAEFGDEVWVEVEDEIWI